VVDGIVNNLGYNCLEKHRLTAIIESLKSPSPLENPLSGDFMNIYKKRMESEL
jgi:hypothetical protein